MASNSEPAHSEPSYFFRPAREGDLPALTAIYNAAVTGSEFTGHFAPLTLDDRRPWWLSHLDPRYPILVAEDAADQTVLGYASLTPWSEGFPVYHHTAESSLYLAPAAQGRGLGTALMRALLGAARQLNFHVVLSRIWAANAASLAMCRKCGYEVIGTQREIGFRDGVWDDCVLLQVIL